MRHVFLSIAVFAIIAAGPWLLWTVDLSGTPETPALPHKWDGDKSYLGGGSQNLGQTALAAPGGPDTHATLEIFSGTIRNTDHAARSQLSVGDDHATLKIIGGKISNSGNHAETAGAATSLEPHAILEIRDGKVARVRRAETPNSRASSGG